MLRVAGGSAASVHARRPLCPSRSSRHPRRRCRTPLALRVGAAIGVRSGGRHEPHGARSIAAPGARVPGHLPPRVRASRCTSRAHRARAPAHTRCRAHDCAARSLARRMGARPAAGGGGVLLATTVTAAAAAAIAVIAAAAAAAFRVGGRWRRSRRVAARSSSPSSPSRQPVRHFVRGLVNSGTVCFANALVQALAAMDPLRAYLGHVCRRAGPRRVPVCAALLLLLHQLSEAHDRPVAATSVLPLLHALRATGRADRRVDRLAGGLSGEQQDAQEFLQVLVEVIQLESTRASGPTALAALAGPPTLPRSPAQLLYGGRIVAQPQLEQPVLPLSGLMGRCTRCLSCAQVMPCRCTPLTCLVLQLPPAPMAQCSLDECLRSIGSIAYLDQRPCGRCMAQAIVAAAAAATTTTVTTTATTAAVQQSASTDAQALGDNIAKAPEQAQATIGVAAAMQRLLRLRCVDEEDVVGLARTLGSALPSCAVTHASYEAIVRAPRLLCLLLSRLRWSPYGHLLKDQRHVAFPLLLDIAPFMELAQSVPCLYRLQAVIAHLGPATSGHYVTLRRAGVSGSWLCCDDVSVRPLSQSDVLASCAYLLFYERADGTGPPCGVSVA